MKLFFTSLEFTCILLVVLFVSPADAQQATADTPASGGRKVEMQGLALDVSTLQAQVASATTRLFKIKECHTAGTLFRSLDDGSEGCKSVIPCQLPWGPVLGVGESATAYQASTVPYGSSCVSQSRTCNESTGELTGTYQYQSCSVGAAASCTLPWGGTLPSGQGVTAYANATSSCSTVQTRTCTNGVLSGTYQYGSCTATCALPWGGTLNSGQSATAYQAASAASCTSQSRLCSNGVLSGSYAYGSCTVTNPFAACTYFTGVVYVCPAPVPGKSCSGPYRQGYACYP